MRLDVARERCIGAGMCVLAAPDHFTQDEDDGLVLPLDPGGLAPDTHDPALAEAARLCPSRALSLAE